MFLLFVLLLSIFNDHQYTSANANGIFTRLPWLDNVKTDQKNYGVAVADVDHDGSFEFIVAGFDGPNIVLKFRNDNTNGEKMLVNLADDEKYKTLQDKDGEAIGVCACDVDGDGKEEIYFLNTNNAYSGKSSYGDKLFKWRDGKYVDLYSDKVNEDVTAKGYAGRSVACVDRKGTGKYSIIIATYSDGTTGQFSLIEMDESNPANNVDKGVIVLKNTAKEAGIERATGGRGIVVGPILNKKGMSDIFFDNEGGANFLFKNNGQGKFKDVATESGIADEKQNGRGVTNGDFNRDGLVDIIYGNWEGPHRIFLQNKSESGKSLFTDIAPLDFSNPSPVRTVIAADFDNDGFTEVLVNNIYSPPEMQSSYDYGGDQPNRLFKIVPNSDNAQQPEINKIDIGQAEEADGSNTGGAYADIDRDGTLELLLSHGESTGQPLQIYKSEQTKEYNFIRIFPVTQYEAPARGASVTMTMIVGGESITQLQVIDGGSGYLCQMEPVAHFGLGNHIDKINVKVQWPDGKTKTLELSKDDINDTHKVEYPTT